MAEPTRIDMARELARHAEQHRRLLESFLPTYDLILSGIPNDPFPFRVTVRPPQRMVGSPTDLDFNLEVRHVVDDLRSALEYCAYDAHERYCRTGLPSEPPYNWKVNFPVVGRNQGPTDFETVLAKEELSELKTKCAPAVDVMRGAQHFASKRGDWLVDLQDLWNEGKHRNLLYQTNGPPEIEVTAVLPGQGPGYKFLRGLRFSGTRKTLDNFFTVARDEVARIIDEMERALYPPTP